VSSSFTSTVHARTVHIGDASPPDGQQILYGGRRGDSLAPSWRYVRFLGIGAGWRLVRPNDDSFVLKTRGL